MMVLKSKSRAAKLAVVELRNADLLHLRFGRQGGQINLKMDIPIAQAESPLSGLPHRKRSQ